MHELGSRSNQEDSLYPLPQDLTDKARCFVLCDGMGGHDSGEVASDAVCRTMGAVADGLNDEGKPFTVESFQAALQAAYDALDARDTQAAKKMGTTMTFLAFHAGGCFVAHIGDSRVYHLRPGQGILFETRDHSLVNDLIKVGELTPEAAKDFPQKNVITRVMQPNQERRARADIKEITDVRPGDYFFMCSDGVNETMESNHIANVLLDEEYSDSDKMRIIKEVTESSRDNHTAFLIRVQSKEEKGERKKENVGNAGEAAVGDAVILSASEESQSADRVISNVSEKSQSARPVIPTKRSAEESQSAKEEILHSVQDDKGVNKEIPLSARNDKNAKKEKPGNGQYRKWTLFLLALFLVSAAVAAAIKIFF